MSYKVPYNYLPFEFNDTTNIFKEWKKLIKSTDFTLGSFVEKFENQFSKFCGVKYCISTNNGTDALILALKSLDIGYEDEVITVPNSFYATTGSIVAVGAKPVFIDCDDRYQIDVQLIESKITKKTKAILPVHWAGASPDMSIIMKIAKKHKLHVVEDACMGIGGKVNSKHPGTFGDVNAFSLHPLKSLNVMGDGGMIVTNNSKIYNWAKKYRNHGMINRDYNDIWGVNMRMQPLQAIVAMENLKKLKKVISIRNRNARMMDKLLKLLNNNVTVPKRILGNIETFSLYMILVKNRDKLVKYLISKGIEAKIHYPIPLHKQKAHIRSKYYKYEKFPIIESQAKHLLTLPMHQFIKSNQIQYMFNCIKDFYSKN